MFNSRKPSADELPSTGRLLRSTAIAAAVAVFILFTTVLPAEYGVDPTGVGQMIGLTQMGETKLRLAREAATEEATGAAPVASKSPAPVAAPPVTPTVAAPIATAATGKTDEVAVTLKPGQAAEIKVEMRKGARIKYRWTANGGRVNFDTHGDPYNAPRSFYHGYGKGRGTEADEGVLEAAFDGFHGWFWRNRTKDTVTVTLRVEGDYSAVKRVL
jgi:hypothetical protein